MSFYYNKKSKPVIGVFNEREDRQELGEVARAPDSLEDLQTCISDWVKNPEWAGKLRVAQTLEWEGSPEEAWECSPNFRGGLWSMDLCKYDMPNQLQSQHGEGLIFTLASMTDSPHGVTGQYLASVALLTQTFQTMGEYARFLLRKPKKVPQERLINVKNQLGRSHIQTGLDWRVQRDIDGKHLRLTSKQFMIWQKPLFRTVTTIHQSIDITSDNLSKLLKSI